MKKRLLAMLLCVAMVASLLTVGAAAETVDEPLAGTCGDNAYWSFDEETATLNISGHGAMYDYDWASDTPYYHIIQNENVENVVIGDSITHIGSYSFYRIQNSMTGYYDTIENVEIGQSVTTVGEFAISSTGIDSLVFPSGVMEIGEGICISPEGTITVPSTVTRIGTYYDSISTNEHMAQFVNYSGAFARCREVIVEDGNERYFSRDGVLYEKCSNGKYNLLYYPEGKTDTSYSVLSNTQEIVMCAFLSNDYISQIVMPNSLKRIGMEAFLGCDSLSDIQLNAGLEKICASAFWNCVSLTRLDIPASVNYFAEEYLGLNGLQDEMPQQPNLDIYFYGSVAPEVFNAEITEVFMNYYGRWDKTYVTIYYPQSSSGWQKYIEEFDEHQLYLIHPDGSKEGLDVLNFEPWDPGPVLPQIVELSPANGATISETATTYFRVTYDTPIAATSTTSAWSFPELDFSNGTIEIRRASDDALIYSVEADPYINELYDIEGTYSGDVKVENGNTLLIQPFNVHTLFDAGEEYYVTIPRNLFKFESGASNETISKNDWLFATIDTSTPFVLGEDNNSFSHNPYAGGGFEGVNSYRLHSKEYIDLIVSDTTYTNWYAYHTFAEEDWNGSCFGIASTMMLIYNNTLPINYISQFPASCYYNLPRPCDDMLLMDTINYFQLIQPFITPTMEAHNSELGQVLTRLVQLLKDSPSEAVILAYNYTKSNGKSSGHAILAVDYSETSDGRHFIRLYDENCIKSDKDSSGSFIDLEISKDYSWFKFTDANGNSITENTCTALAIYTSDNFQDYLAGINEANHGITSIITIPEPGIIYYNSQGETLVFEGDGSFSGTMEVYSATPLVCEHDGSSTPWLLRIDETEQLTIVANGKNVDISFFADEYYLAANVNNVNTLMLSNTEGIEVLPSDNTTHFNAFFGKQEIGKDLVAVTGSANGRIKINAERIDGTITISTEGEIVNYEESRIDGYGEWPLNIENANEGTALPTDHNEGNNNETTSPLPFTDVSTGDWFYDYVAYVYANGLMDGVSGTEFNPNGTMTRAMLWTILARIDGQTVTGESWIETARAWAMSEGVSDGENANGLVTREQFATMLWRYAGEPASDYSLAAYTDASGVSDWAQAAMCWAVENGIITGVSATTIDPQGTATRAQAAAMLMRFIENIG